MVPVLDDVRTNMARWRLLVIGRCRCVVISETGLSCGALGLDVGRVGPRKCRKRHAVIRDNLTKTRTCDRGRAYDYELLGLTRRVRGGSHAARLMRHGRP